MPRSRSPRCLAPTKGHDHASEEILRVANPTPRASQLIHGGAPLGCLFRDVSEEEASTCVARCLELGVRYFDTAPLYGAGLSERRLGLALKDRSDVLISTKCGRVIKSQHQLTQEDRLERGYAGVDGGPYFADVYHMDRPCWDYTGSGVRESVRQSCERLGVDKLHCLRLHDAEDEARYAEATADGGACDTMIALKKEGKVSEISLGMNKHEYILRFLRKYPNTFDSIMLAGCFNLVDNDCIKLLLECQKQGVKVTNVGVFASGLLWGGSHYKYSAEIPDDVRHKVAKWSELAAKYGLSLPQVALNFALLPSCVDHVAFGTSRAAEVEQNLALVGVTVPAALWAEAKGLGLIHEAVPIPH